MSSDDEHTEHWEHDDDEYGITDPAADRFITDPEDWQDMWSGELVIMWHALLDKRNELGAAVLDKCTIADFTQFCFEHSTGLKTKYT